MMLSHSKSVVYLKSCCWLLLLASVQSCVLLRPAPTTGVSRTRVPFMDHIQITLNANKAVNRENDVLVGWVEDKATANYITAFQGIEYLPPVLFRYAVLLDVEVEKITNRRLFEYINQWWGVPYRIGGTSMAGIDCSAFVKSLSLETYSLDIPRTSSEQADFCAEIRREELREGDLVFFNTTGRISHVGLYLSNNKFVHASTSAGVVISDLNEPYWIKRFVKAGRLLGTGG